MRQTVLRVVLPEQSGYKSGFFYRKLCSDVSDGALDNVLFWRDAENKEICERPGIRWVGAYGGFQLIANDEYENALMAASPLLMRVFAEKNMRCTVEMGFRNVDTMEYTDGLLEYKINQFVYDPHRQKSLAFADATTQQKKDILTSYLRDQLLQEAACWNVDESDLELHGNDLRISQIEKAYGISYENKEGEFKRKARSYKVTFTMPIRLNGCWQVGKLISKGFGNIRLVGSI